MIHFRVQNGPFSKENDVFTSQNRRLIRLWCSSLRFCASVRQGYLHVACNSSMRQGRSFGRFSVIGNSRRLGCRKQLWPLAFSCLLQHVHNKKKLFTLKNQLWLSNQQLNTKISSERALLPAPTLTRVVRNPLFSKGELC